MKRTIRVLHIMGDSRYGGGSYIVQRLAEFSQRKGVSVDVLTTDGAFQSKLRQAHVGVVDVPWVRRAVGLHDVEGVWRLRRFLRQEQYTIVHTHTSKGGVIGRLAAHLAGVPIVIHTAHGYAFHEHSPKHKIAAYSAIEKRAAAWCSALVTVSHFHRQWALDLGIAGPHQVVAVPNGIPEERVKATKSREATRRELGVGAEDYLVLSTGRLVGEKGFETALYAVRSLAERLPRQVRFAIAGDGPLRPRLEGLIKSLALDGIAIILGFRENVGDLLLAADAFALASQREGLSISLLEAMAAGKAIVASDIGSNREVLQGGMAGRLVAVGDSNELAAAIADYVARREEARLLGLHARETYEMKYTEKRMLDEYGTLYDSLLHRSKRDGAFHPVRAFSAEGVS